MRILFVIDHLGKGGAEQQFVQIANGIRADKAVFLTEAGGVRTSALHKDIPSFGGHGRRTPLRTVFELKSIIDHWRPDIVHACLMYSCFVVALSLKLSKNHPALIVQEFSSPEEILNEVKFPAIKKTLLRFAYRRAQKVLTVSRSVMEEIIEKGFVADARKASYIHDGLDLGKFMSMEPREKLREQLGLSSGECYLTFVGSLVERKGVRYLIEAFREVPEESARLLVVGEGPEAPLMKRMAQGDERIVFLGYKENGVEYIRASDIFVLPSFYEGLPNVIIEALLVGTPVIATNVSGVPEIIEDDVTGLLVKPRDKKSLRHAMIRMIADPSLRVRLAEEAIKKADYFGVERMLTQYEALYNELVEIDLYNQN